MEYLTYTSVVRIVACCPQPWRHRGAAAALLLGSRFTAGEQMTDISQTLLEAPRRGERNPAPNPPRHT
jgi:hypothetical protein